MSDAAATPPTPPVADEEVVKRARVRIALACEPCRARKIKCNGKTPCSKCIFGDREQECTFLPDRRSRRQRTSLARPLAPARPGDAPHGAVNRATSFREHAANLDSYASTEKHQELRAGIAAFNPDTDAYQFYGPSSHFSFVQRLYQRIRRQSHRPLMLEVQPRVPEGLRRWGVEHQLFSHGDEHSNQPGDIFTGNMLPKDLGDAFISRYFSIMHPQAPMLGKAEVLRTWQSLWEAPSSNANNSRYEKEKSILYMVLAIGARLLDQGTGEAVAIWANHFYKRAGKLNDVFEESSLLGTQLLLLRAMYAMQIGKPNWVYMYLGHACRSAMAIGLHRSQVVAGDDPFANKLRITFWTIYYMEKTMCMFLGRPSSLSDDHIDAPFPDEVAADTDTPSAQYAYVRAMAVIGRVSDSIMSSNFSSKVAKRVSELGRVNKLNDESAETLRGLLKTLPDFLRFFDNTSQVGEVWQEVQRTCLGITHHMTIMLMYRPALIYVTFFDSLTLAQESIGDLIDIKKDMSLAIGAATSLIDLTCDVFFNRCPSLRRDGNTVLFIVSACLTLLFQVLDSDTTPEHAREVFLVVERGLKCLDSVDHIGSTTGRAISLDVMKVAKDALLSTGADTRLDVVEDFAWLSNAAIEQSLQDNSGSWLHDAIGANTVDQTNAFSSLYGPNESNQMIFDLMGEGSRFVDGNFGPAPF